MFSILRFPTNDFMLEFYIQQQRYNTCWENLSTNQNAKAEYYVSLDAAICFVDVHQYVLWSWCGLRVQSSSLCRVAARSSELFCAAYFSYEDAGALSNQSVA